jgi:hypothetical protein
MSRQQKILAAKFATVLWVIPVMIYAKADGPDPRKTGAPGDNLCTECHVGTANPSGGKVEVSFAGGLTYTPGAKQRLTVTVTDLQARGVNGFQLTARLASNESNGRRARSRPGRF